MSETLMDPVALAIGGTLVALVVLFIILAKTVEVDQPRGSGSPKGGSQAGGTPSQGNEWADVQSDKPAEKPLDYVGHINKGNQHITSYQWEEALYHFQQALKFKNNDPSLHFKIGRVCVQKEDFRNAEIAFRQVIGLTPNKIEAYFELARLLVDQNRLAEAHQELDKALEFNPRHEEVLKLKVKIYEMTRDYEAILPVVKRLFEVNNRNKDYHLIYAQALYHCGQREKAIEEYRAMAEWDPRNKMQYYTRIAQIYMELHDYGKAVEYFNDVFTSDSIETRDPAVRAQMAAALCNQGVKLFADGDVDTSVRNYKKALDYDKENPDIHFNLGKAYLVKGNVSAAQAAYEEVIRLSPKDVSAYYEIGLLHDTQSNIREAMVAYKHCLELQPNFAKAAFGLGTLYGVQGDLKESQKFLAEAVRLDPNYVDAIYNLAVAQEKLKQHKKAIQLYKQVLSLDAGHLEAKSNLAHLQKVLKG